MENKHTPGLPAISYPAGNYAIVTFEIPEDISKSQSHAIVRGPKHKKYAKLIASAPSLQSEIDRLKEERQELVKAVKAFVDLKTTSVNGVVLVDANNKAEREAIQNLITRIK